MKFERTSITLPAATLRTGKKQAKKEARNFSSYVAALIDKDAKSLTQEARVAKSAA